MGGGLSIKVLMVHKDQRRKSSSEGDTCPGYTREFVANVGRNPARCNTPNKKNSEKNSLSSDTIATLKDSVKDIPGDNLSFTLNLGRQGSDHFP